MQYMFLNRFVNRIPSWHVRRFFYELSGMKISKGARIGIKTIIVGPEGISKDIMVIIQIRVEDKGKKLRQMIKYLQL